MELIEEFVKKALEEDGPFTIMTSKRLDFKFYTQIRMGNARFIYCGYNYNYSDVMTSPDINSKLSLSAIVSDGVVYIINTYDTGAFELSGKLLGRAVYFRDFVAEKNKEECLKLYSALQIREISEDDEKSCIEAARRIRIYQNYEEKEVGIRNVVSAQNVADSLCGFIDLETIARGNMEEDKDAWISEKSCNKRTNELLDNGMAVENWEVRMADGLNRTDAKSVTVEFNIGGKTASEKMKPDRILFKLLDKDNFSDYDFDNTKRGGEMMRSIGASNSRFQGRALMCEDISRITYKRKDIYVKE